MTRRSRKTPAIGQLTHIGEIVDKLQLSLNPPPSSPTPNARTPYNICRASHSAQYGYEPTGPSLTVQSQKQEADINYIVEQFGITGRMPENLRTPNYGDYSEVLDFRSAIHAVREAESEFLRIPAAIRSRFQNDPQQFLEFCMDQNNLPALREMGLADPAAPQPAAPEPTPAKAP